MHNYKYIVNEYRTQKTVVLRIMNLALMKFSLLSCGLKHTPIFSFLSLYCSRLFAWCHLYKPILFSFTTCGWTHKCLGPLVKCLALTTHQQLKLAFCGHHVGCEILQLFYSCTSWHISLLQAVMNIMSETRPFCCRLQSRPRLHWRLLQQWRIAKGKAEIAPLFYHDFLWDYAPSESGLAF